MGDWWSVTCDDMGVEFGICRAGEVPSMSDLFEQTYRVLGGDSVVAESASKLGVAAASGEQQTLQQNRLRFALLRIGLRQIVEALGEDIPFVILKGEPLSRRLFDQPEFRSTTDVDLLVLPGDHDEVRRRLLGLGFVARQEGPRKWAYNQEALVHPGSSVVMEIHWAIAFPALPPLPIKDLFERRRSFELAPDLDVPILSDDWTGIHLALHFHQHIGCAKCLLDMAAFCSRIAPGLDASAFQDRVAELGLSGVVQWPLHTLELLTGDPPPLYLADVDPTVRAWAVVSAWALRGCLSRRFRGGVQDSLASLNPTTGPSAEVLLRALTMLTVDGTAEKSRAFWRPIFHGPHFLGRAMHRWGAIR